jgi:hypothetical protein
MAWDYPEASNFAGDWEYTEGVEDLGYSWAEDRKFNDAAPAAAPLTGIKGRRGNPSEKQLIYSGAVGIGVQSDDQIWTIWADTFPAGYKPRHGDIILVNEMDDGVIVDPLNVIERWLVQWVKVTMYGSQYLCYCASSPLTLPDRDTIPS